jgi:hypothetical protein
VTRKIHVRRLSGLSCALIVLALLSACSTPTRTTSSFDGTKYSGPVFSNLLVLGVADNYNNRAEFERTLASRIRSDRTAATPVYTLVKKDTVIDRDVVLKLVEEGGYDAVLIARVLNRDVASKVKDGAPAAKVTTKGGNVVDLFRYDYEELDNPQEIEMALNVVVSTEVFTTATNSRVWAIESDTPERDSPQLVILDAVDAITEALRKDKLIGK